MQLFTPPVSAENVDTMVMTMAQQGIQPPYLLVATTLEIFAPEVQAEFKHVENPYTYPGFEHYAVVVTYGDNIEIAIPYHEVVSSETTSDQNTENDSCLYVSPVKSGNPELN